MATNLTGLYYNRTGNLKLISIYKKILLVATKFPKDYTYRKSVEDIVCHRLCIVQESGYNRNEIEDRICSGPIETLIWQAENEFSLIQKMILWKPWKTLVEQPPPDQWKWPAL